MQIAVIIKNNFLQSHVIQIIIQTWISFEKKKYGEVF
jgi:hypothetical protein